MRNMIRAVHDARLDRLFVAHVQSALGTGAGYVVLLLLVYERFDSPWALTVVLLAGFLPRCCSGRCSERPSIAGRDDGARSPPT